MVYELSMYCISFLKGSVLEWMSSELVRWVDGLGTCGFEKTIFFLVDMPYNYGILQLFFI